MDKEEIIRMAREAGLAYGPDEKPLGSVIRFATFVAAAEREACAKACEILGAEDDSFYAEFSRAKDCAAAIRARSKS